MMPGQEELAEARRCAAAFFSPAAGSPLPFSFRLGGRPSADSLRGWRRSAQSHPLDGARTEHTLVLADPMTGLEVRVDAVEFLDLPAVEWVVRLKNTGGADTPLIEQVQALDLEQPCADSCILHYSLGALCSPDDFAPVERRFRRGAGLRLTPRGGRSSSEILPFFNIDRGGSGTVVAIGWSGEWAAEFTRGQDGTVRVRGGMNLTRLVLRAGEEIRTPSILLVFWNGDRLRGHNMLRAQILRRHRPSLNGSPLVLPSFAGNWGATPAEIHLGNLRRLDEHRLPVEWYWIDAGWFGSGPWHLNPGTWEANRALYPRGMREVGNAVHSSGRRFLLWLEPQRVCAGSAWAREHPEWLLHIPPEDEVTSWPGWDDTDDPSWRFAESRRNRIAKGDALLNLAVPEARRFLTDFISRCVEEFGLDCYREDFNIAPLSFWRRADAPDRQGMTEIRWIEGLYAFWDELLGRHPGLMIDNCASGGRRIDIESLGRATPLWRTDAPGTPEARQCHTWGLSAWVPLHATGGLPDLTKATDYEFRSSLNAGLICGFGIPGDGPQTEPYHAGLEYDRARSFLEQFEMLRPYFYGDFYPLSEYSLALDAWLGYQYHRPDLQAGMALVFKRPRSALKEAAYSLQGLDPGSRYHVRNLDTREVTTLSGAALADGGLVVRLEGRPASALLVYARADGQAAC
jgi:alpha-galactosidase